MWRPATTNDIGKKCRVRDYQDEDWIRGKNDWILEGVQEDECFEYPFSITGPDSDNTDDYVWAYCEVWDQPRTEITWENIKDDDRLKLQWNGANVNFGWLRENVEIIQRPQPKLLITKQMILDKFGKSEGEVEIKLD